MGVVTLRYGCPICQTDITGNNELHFLCGQCGVTYAPELVRKKLVRRELITHFVEFVKSPDGDVYHIETCKYAKRIEQPVRIAHSQVGNLRACACTKGDRYVDT